MALRLSMLVDSPSKGTYANLVNRLALGLAEAGRTETSIVCYRDGPVPAWLPTEVRIHRLGTQRASRSVGSLLRYVRSDQPDVLLTRQVHANFLGLAVGGLARIQRQWHGKLVVAHDHPAALSHASDVRDNKWVAKAAYRFASGVIAVSPTVRDDVIRWSRVHPSSVGLVPNPTAPFAGPDPEPPHPWLEPSGPPVFVTAARLVRYKRIDLLVDAFHEIGRRHDVRLLIIGEGPERGALANQIEQLDLVNKAQAVGWVPDPLQFMARATAFVLPSNEEGFSQVLTEAMSTRCPVVAADALGGGPRFVTDEGRCGVLVPRNDLRRLVQAMEQMLSPDVRESYAALGLERIAVFSPLACANALVDFLEGLPPSGRVRLGT